VTRQYHQNILGRPGNITKHKLVQPGNIIRNKHSDSAKQFSETDITKMLEVFIDSIFGGNPFEQTVDNSMGSNCALLYTVLFCYSYLAAGV
jgi:hypothetical protein